MKKSNSEFFEVKKKKKWTSIFSSKEKLRNSSSQIFLTAAENEKLKNEKGNDSMILKNQEVFNTIEGQQAGNIRNTYIYIYISSNNNKNNNNYNNNNNNN